MMESHFSCLLEDNRLQCLGKREIIVCEIMRKITLLVSIAFLVWEALLSPLLLNVIYFPYMIISWSQ